MKQTTNNPNGRPKGTGNVAAAAIREQIRNGIVSNDLIISLFDSLKQIKDPYKYVQTALSIIDMVLPRLPQEQQPDQPKTDIQSAFERVFARMHDSYYHKDVDPPTTLIQ